MLELDHVRPPDTPTPIGDAGTDASAPRASDTVGASRPRHARGATLSHMVEQLLQDAWPPLPAPGGGPHQRPRADRGAGAVRGADPLHDLLRDVAQQAARHVGELCERRLDRGDIDMATLFPPRRDQAASTTDAPLRALRQFVEAELPAICRPIIEAFPQVAFACCTDAGGHLPVAHDAGTNCLAASIYVRGRRWGTFAVGYRAPVAVAPPPGGHPQDDWRV